MSSIFSFLMIIQVNGDEIERCLQAIIAEEEETKKDSEYIKKTRIEIDELFAEIQKTYNDFKDEED